MTPQRCPDRVGVTVQPVLSASRSAPCHLLLRVPRTRHVDTIQQHRARIVCGCRVSAPEPCIVAAGLALLRTPAAGLLPGPSQAWPPCRAGRPHRARSRLLRAAAARGRARSVRRTSSCRTLGRTGMIREHRPEGVAFGTDGAAFQTRCWTIHRGVTPGRARARPSGEVLLPDGGRALAARRRGRRRQAGTIRARRTLPSTGRRPRPGGGRRRLPACGRTALPFRSRPDP